MEANDIIKLLTDFVFAAVFAWFLRKEQSERKADNEAADVRYDAMLKEQQTRQDKLLSRLIHRDVEPITRPATRPIRTPDLDPQAYLAEMEREV